MNSPQYDNNLLRQYLLGGLSEVQDAEFDELSIIDDEFASQLGEVENDLIDDYVQGTLSGQVRAQFESRYLTSPRRRERVKFAQSLKTFAETKAKARTLNAIIAASSAAETSSTKAAPLRPTTYSAVPWWQRWFALPSLKLQWGFAAMALLLLLAGGWLYWEISHLREQVAKVEAERTTLQQREKELQAQIEAQRAQGTKESQQPQQERQHTFRKPTQSEPQVAVTKKQANDVEKRLKQAEANAQHLSGQTEQQNVITAKTPNFISLTLRSVSRGVAFKAIPIDVSKEVDYVSLTLLLGTDDFPVYRVELRTELENKKVWSRAKIRPQSQDGAKIIVARIPADKLATGGYNLTISKITAPHESVRQYYFQVVKP